MIWCACTRGVRVTFAHRVGCGGIKASQRRAASKGSRTEMSKWRRRLAALLKARGIPSRLRYRRLCTSFEREDAALLLPSLKYPLNLLKHLIALVAVSGGYKTVGSCLLLA
jgi:hypothetical protein